MLITLYAVVNTFAKNIKISKNGKTKVMTYTVETLYQAEITQHTQATQHTDNESQSVNLDEIISCTLQQEFVLGARAFEWNGSIVVAALTTPFVLKSERDSAKNQLSEDLQTAFSAHNIILTFDMQVYRNILDELDDLAKQELLELAKSR